MKKIILLLFTILLLFGKKVTICHASDSINLEGVIVTVARDGNLYLLLGETGSRIQLTDDAGVFYYQDPGFSPDGRKLAYLKSDPEKGETVYDLVVMDLQDRSSFRLAENINSNDSFRWMPDSQAIVFGYSLDVVCKAPDQDATLGLFKVDIRSGELEEIIHAPAANIPLMKPVVSDDGNWISYRSFPCFSEGWNSHTRNLQSGEEYNFAVSALDWKPGENSLAWTQEPGSGGDGSVFLVSADQNQSELLFQPDGLTAADPHWSPDAKWLVLRLYPRVEGFYLSEEEAANWVDELVIISHDGSLIDTICSTQSINACQFEAWSPSGNTVIFSLNEGLQKEWHLYSLDSGQSDILADIGDGGVDWIESVQFMEEGAITPTGIKTPEAKEISAQEMDIVSTQEIQREISQPRTKAFVLILIGVLFLILSLFMVVLLVLYLRGKKKH